jgi:hypothetical protein
MIPGPGIGSAQYLDRESFEYYQYLAELPDEDYAAHNTARWSYGGTLDWAYSIDVRYRINKSLDSLRKFPIIRYRREMHLNQGFHDLIVDGEKRSAVELQRADLLPIVHFKLWLLSRSDGVTNGKEFSAYHHETRENLRTLSREIDKMIISASAQPQIYRYLGYELIPTPSCQTIEIRVRTDDEAASDRDTMQRSAPILLEGFRDEVRLTGRRFVAPTLQALIDWLCQNTPFCRIMERSDEKVVLVAAPPTRRWEAPEAR